jgi:hypothetical protein
MYRATGQDPLQAGPLQKEVEPVYSSLAGLPTGLGTETRAFAVTVCIKPRISSLDLLVESTVVIGDLSQRQMVTKEHCEHQKAGGKVAD